MIRRRPLAAWLIGLTLCGGQTLAAEPAPTEFSAAGLYNLANSYARAGKPGMAVLYYERARLLAPDDPDIEANLNYVRESSRLPREAPTALARALRFAAPTVAAWIGLAGLLIVGTSLLAGRLSSRHRWLRRAGAALGLSMVGLTIGNGVVLWPALHEAVVISAGAPVRVAPVPMGDAAFVLAEAETVHMRAEHEGFVLIRTRAGRSGWVSRANLAAVVPTS
jgi:tetratricopeptide (TPR) repeat protein